MGIIKMHAKSLIVMFLILQTANFSILTQTAEATLACYNCHGTNSTHDIRPEDAASRSPSTGGFPGNHRTHMGETAAAASCAKCHPGSSDYTSSHRDGWIKLGANINQSLQNAVYKGSTSAFPQSTAPNHGNCTNVNCHFGKITPQWGSPPLSNAGNLTATGDCTICHNAPPSDGKHEGKHRKYYGNGTVVCSKCHPNHPVE